MVYADAPWTFTGRALYQLQLVKADEARKHIPEQLKLVEFCGYTLGGVYLARYDDSPAGCFDECVAMAGLVWNPPTSCAWAARVFVNNREARDHGRRSVGLPSRLAAFNTLSQAASSSTAWWSGSTQQQQKKQQRAAVRQQLQQPAADPGSSGDVIELCNVDGGRRGLPQRPVCVFRLPALPTGGFLGPRLRLSLPSFSGGTSEHPGLLQYSCDLATNILPVAPLQIQLPQAAGAAAGRQGEGRQQRQQQQHPEVLDLLLDGKPLLCLAFSNMEMRVEEPVSLQLPAPAAAPQPAAAPHMVPALAALMPPRS